MKINFPRKKQLKICFRIFASNYFTFLVYKYEMFDQFGILDPILRFLF